MTDFVKRPIKTASGRWRIDYDAMIATADNGKAITIKCPPENRAGTSSNVSAVIGRRHLGLRAHTSYDRKTHTLTLWCTRVPPNGGPTRETP